MKRLERLLMSLVFTLGCGSFAEPGRRLSESDEFLKSPEILKRTPVLIYYANDRNITPGEDAVEQRHRDLEALWAQMFGNKSAPAAMRFEAGRILRALREDATEFPKAVTEEMDLLRNLFCAGKSPLSAGLVMIRNWGSVSLVDHPRFGSVKRTLLRYEFCLPTNGSNQPILQTRYIEQEWDATRVLEDKDVLLSQPLALNRVFELFLKDVQKVFPPTDYRFAFYGKSRGSKAYFFEGPLTDGFQRNPPEKVSPVVNQILSDVQALPADKTSNRTIATLVFDSLRKLDPPPPENPDSNQFLEKGTLLNILYSLEGNDPLKAMHITHFVLDSNYAAVELSPVQNAKDFLRAPPKYSNMGISSVDYLHFRDSIDSYRPYGLNRLFPLGRPVGSDFIEHFGKHIENWAPSASE